jgi:gag-polyprotein putative aspartyl protease
LRIFGERGQANLFYITTLVWSPTINKLSTIRFYVDTGATLTMISEKDALRNGIDFRRILVKSTDQVKGIGGRVSAYRLPLCRIVFLTDTGINAEDLDYVNILSNEKQSQEEPIELSLLGLDILIRYKIYFLKDITYKDRIVLEKDSPPVMTRPY